MSDATVRSFRRRGGRLAEVPSSLGSVAVEPRLAVEMAQLHGLLQYDADARVGHAPFMLTPYALKPGQLACLQRWTPLFNRLVWKLGADRAFLRDILEPCAEADPFLARLLAILPAAARDLQPARIVLLRSDYLMERSSERADAAPREAAGGDHQERGVFLLSALRSPGAEAGRAEHHRRQLRRAGTDAAARARDLTRRAFGGESGAQSGALASGGAFCGGHEGL